MNRGACFCVCLPTVASKDVFEIVMKCAGHIGRLPGRSTKCVLLLHGYGTKFLS
jgi:hypothetical protein